MYTNQIGQFPIVSSKGNKYLMVAVEMDGNYIDVESMKSRETGSFVKAYQTIWSLWKATSAVSPNWHVLDNEARIELKQAIKENECTLELTPSDIH